jgi:hypothetical protein
VLGGIKYAAEAINPWLFFIAAGYVLFALSRLFRHGLREGDVASTIVVALFCYLTLVHTVLQAEPRYSIPYRPLEFVLVMLALHALFERLASLRQRAIAPGKDAVA